MNEIAGEESFDFYGIVVNKRRARLLSWFFQYDSPQWTRCFYSVSILRAPCRTSMRSDLTLLFRGAIVNRTKYC